MQQIVLALLRAAHDYAEAANASRVEMVKLARNTDLTWEEIGAVMGISKQAAQKRYGAAVGEPDHATRRATRRLEAIANGDDDPPAPIPPA